MKRSSVAHWNCSVARTLDVVGEWWSLLILRDVFFGVHRFEDLQSDLGIARNILTDRLGTLVDAEVLKRVRYQERPERFEYRLTESGEDLFGVVLELMRWGDQWRAPDGEPMWLIHRTCGERTEPGRRCSNCGEVLTRFDVTPRTGPGWVPAS